MVSHVLGYTDFGSWYDVYRDDVMDPALAEASAALAEVIDDQLSDRDLTRIRTTTGRVKSKRRTWRKLHHPRYEGRITATEDIPAVIDDLVGLRITCINLRDIEMVQAALDSLPKRRPRRGGLWLEPDTERDYVAEPKESGYRGWHVNLGIVIGAASGRMPVTCELQVRTLLEDSWGELTHEDTYSKDGSLPPLVAVLSRRMADLLSTLDDIAEDLRTELDRIDDVAVADTNDDATQPDVVTAPSEQAADAAAMLLDNWRRLDRPVDLASLAWALQREFGAEISDDWFGRRSFKRFLRHAIPDAEISSGNQAYLLPAHYGPDTPQPPDTADDTATEAVTPDAAIPEVAMALRRIDRGFPLLDAAEWPALYRHLSEAWRRFGARKPSMAVVNQLSRSARDRAAADGSALSRRHFDYVAKAVLPATDSQQPPDAAAIATAFTAATIERMTQLRLLDQRDRKTRSAVQRWLRA